MAEAGKSYALRARSASAGSFLVAHRTAPLLFQHRRARVTELKEGASHVRSWGQRSGATRSFARTVKRGANLARGVFGSNCRADGFVLPACLPSVRSVPVGAGQRRAESRKTRGARGPMSTPCSWGLSPCEDLQSRRCASVSCRTRSAVRCSLIQGDAQPKGLAHRSPRLPRSPSRRTRGDGSPRFSGSFRKLQRSHRCCC